MKRRLGGDGGDGDDGEHAMAAQYRTSANLEARVALHRACSTNPYGFPRWVFDRLGLRPGKRVLEVGCGSGTLWRNNAERLPAGVALTLSDRSLGMVATARDACGESVATRFATGALPDLPFATGSFDVAIANHMLYHVTERPGALRELRRTLRRGGLLLATTNGAAHLRELGELMRELGVEPATVSRAFSLENGAAQLRRVFPNVRREDYLDSLRVTEPDLLLDYVASIGSAAHATVTRCRDEVREALAARIARDGAFEITKSTGAFLAWDG
jgi:SAM-dependent methyltransferase